MNGIFIKKDVKITKTQAEALWGKGYRIVYSDITGNSCLRDNANTCAYQGFRMGLYHRLRYPPEKGSADSQAQEFAVAEEALMRNYPGVLFSNPVLHLAKGEPVLCETSFYRNSVMTFLQKYRSYHGESNFLVKCTDEFITWLQPTQQIVDNFPLWIHEPTAVVKYAPWKWYVWRSYAARSMEGVMAEPVEPWGDPIIPPPPVVPPVVVKLTAQQQLEAIAKIIADNK